MADTKPEIVQAAIDAGLIDNAAEGEALTKSELLALWG